MEKKFREGSMGAKEAAQEKLWLKIFSGIFGVVFLLWILPFNPCGGLGFAHYYFTQSGWFAKLIAFVSIGLYYWFLWKKLRKIDNPTGAIFAPQTMVMFGWFALNLFLLSGFVLDLPNC